MFCCNVSGSDFSRNFKVTSSSSVSLHKQMAPSLSRFLPELPPLTIRAPAADGAPRKDGPNRGRGGGQPGGFQVWSRRSSPRYNPPFLRAGRERRVQSSGFIPPLSAAWFPASEPETRAGDRRGAAARPQLCMCSFHLRLEVLLL